MMGLHKIRLVYLITLVILLLLLHHGTFAQNVSTPSEELSKEQLDQAISDLLEKHAINDEALNDVKGFSSDLLEKLLQADYRFRGYNSKRSARGVYFYIVDQKTLRHDENACGPTGNAHDVQPSQRDMCYRVGALEDNCAVLGPTTIACDFQLIWRLSRYASTLAISTLKRPGRDEYYFPRETLRRKFLEEEQRFDSTNKQLANLRYSNYSFSQKFSFIQDARDRALKGFLMFLLSHEAGHIQLGHCNTTVAGRCESLSNNADDQVHIPWQLCRMPDQMELDADKFAIAFMAGDINPRAFTPARAAPEFFIEEHERRLHLSIVSIGQDPEKWKYEAASPNLKKRFEEEWLKNLATGSHPKDLARYVALLDLLESKGVQLITSRTGRSIANDELSAIKRWCDSAQTN